MKALNPELLEEAARVFAKAFFHDPLYRWFFPSERSRFRKIVAFYRVLFLANIRHVWVSSDLLEGIAIWKSPYESGITLSFSLLIQGVMFVFSVGVGALVKMIFFACVTASFRKRYRDERAFFLSAIGVDPPCQGKGIGKEMIKELLKEAERVGFCVYLETQNPTNVPYYKRFGFVVVDQARIVSLDYFLMKREVKLDGVGDK
ncbi:MAG: GNAT family N-acetyltransferase [Brevinematales bacterium]